MLAQGRTGWKTMVVAGLLVTMTIMAMGCTSNRIIRKQGMVAYEDGQYNKAHDIFARGIERNASDWKSHYYLGLIALKQGRPMDAQLAIEKALSVRSNHDQTQDMLDHLAQSLYEQQKFDNLAAMLQQSADRYGTTRDYLRQANYMGLSGDVDGAKLAYLKAIRFARKDDVTPFIALADFYDELGAGADALLVLRQAYYITPDDPSLAEKIRKHGMVPGPTIAIEPQR